MKHLPLFIAGIFFLTSCSFFPKPLSEVLSYENLNFSGEKVPLLDAYSMNQEKLEREVFLMQYNTAQYLLYQKRRNLYFPYIESALKEAELPDDIKYLAVAESWLKNDARSGVGALGVWQFMPDTAKQQGLIVTDFVDERLNFEKSTHAALAYLARLQKRFQSWTLAAAAYNRGQTGLARELEEQKVNSYYDLFLNQETSRYIYRIVAIKYLTLYEELFFSNVSLKESYIRPKTRTLLVTEIPDLIDFSQEHGCTYAQIKELNPWILQSKLPKGNWTVTLCGNE